MFYLIVLKFKVRLKFVKIIINSTLGGYFWNVFLKYIVMKETKNEFDLKPLAEQII